MFGLGFGFGEIALILLLALLLFGHKLPKVANYFGRTVTEVRKGVESAKEDWQDSMKS